MYYLLRYIWIPTFAVACYFSVASMSAATPLTVTLLVALPLNVFVPRNWELTFIAAAVSVACICQPVTSFGSGSEEYLMSGGPGVRMTAFEIHAMRLHNFRPAHTDSSTGLPLPWNYRMHDVRTAIPTLAILVIDILFLGGLVWFTRIIERRHFGKRASPVNLAEVPA